MQFLRHAVAPGLAAAAILGTASVSGTTILVDFGNDDSFRGADVVNPDENGNYWTSTWSGAFYANVVDKNNNPTTIDIGYSTGGTGTDFFNGPAGSTQDPAASVVDDVALGDLSADEAVYDYYVGTSASPLRFEIQQLNPTSVYDLVFFGSRDFTSNSDITRYSIYSDATYTTLVTSVDLSTVGTDFFNHNQDKVGTIAGVAPQTNNILYVQVEGANGGNGYINALSVTEIVPEPASLTLLAAGGLLALSRRRQA